jgi:hypothetical protein
LQRRILSFVLQIIVENVRSSSDDSILLLEALSRLKKVNCLLQRLKGWSKRVTRPRHLRCDNEHHQRVATAICKAITGVNVLVAKEAIYRI